VAHGWQEDDRPDTGADPAELRGGAGGVNVIVSAHAERQLEVLGAPAAEALDELRSLSRDDIAWMAERLVPQGGREVWMLWARRVRVLFDLEDDDLTVQGFGRRPGH